MMSDREILGLLKSNEKIAFDCLYDKYAPLLYGRITDLTDDTTIACNLLQKSFVEIWRDVGLYNSAETPLLIWMLQIIMKNCCADLKLNPWN